MTSFHRLFATAAMTLEAESVGLVPFREAIEFPNPDFAALARACGVTELPRASRVN